MTRDSLFKLEAPSCAPESVSARRALAERIASLPDEGGVHCDAACFLRELRGAAPDRLLTVAPAWCALDRAVPRVWGHVSRRAAEREAALYGARVDEASAATDVGVSVGLAVEARARAALLAEHLGASELDSIARAVLPALHPEALRGGDSIEAHVAGLARLREACRVHGLSLRSQLSSGTEVEIRGRVKQLRVGAEDDSGLAFTWSRARGTRLQLGGIREALDAFAIDVQGDAAVPHEGDFVAGLPERPRRFLCSDFRPVCSARKGDPSFARFERELKLPCDPALPGGRKRVHDVAIEVRVSDADDRRLDVAVDWAGALPRHRYRLCIPVPVYPRPARFSSAGVPVEVEGAFGPRAVDASIDLVLGDRVLRVESPCLVEAELFPLRNDHVLAVTLARTGDAEYSSGGASFALRVVEAR